MIFMGKKGGNKKVKAINTPRTVFIKRKENVWSIKTKAGAHKKNSSVALGIVLRDYIKIADSVKEIKQMLHAGDVNDAVVKMAPIADEGLLCKRDRNFENGSKSTFSC